MPVGATIKVGGLKELRTFIARLDREGPKNINESLYWYAQLVAGNLRKSLLSYPRKPTPNRTQAAFKIKAKKLSKFRSVITMPKSLV